MAISRKRAKLLDDLFVETRMLFRSLRGVAGRIHQGGAQTAARRSILVELAQSGPQTVPAMADARHLTRQAIQGFVNALAEEGLVERFANPEHKRSWLWRTTKAGRTVVVGMRERERGVVGDLKVRAQTQQIADACRVLAEVRQAIDAL